MSRLPFRLVVMVAMTVAAMVRAATELPSVFGHHMVLQRNHDSPVWGWDAPGQEVAVSCADQIHRTIAGADGMWRITLDSLGTSTVTCRLTVTGSSVVVFDDVLVDEVWICAGQSNMARALSTIWDGDIVARAAQNPHLRLLRVPALGSRALRNKFDGQWQRTDPTTAAAFSVIGFIFGDNLQHILGVPVGLISNAWGGSAAETWIRRSAMEADPRFFNLMRGIAVREAYCATPAAGIQYEKDLQEWNDSRDRAMREGLRPPETRSRSPDEWLVGNKIPGNGFDGSLRPILGYAMRGVIWYQGEGNTGYARGYRDLFPVMIEQWRAEWGQRDFPFYWVQLPNYTPAPNREGGAEWAELREGQTLALRLPRTGQVVTLGLGESNDIHPREKRHIALRLLRLALHNDYSFTDLAYRSPEYRSHEVRREKIVVSLDCFGG